MQWLFVALQIYALGFIISFLVAVMIKIMMFSIRHMSRKASQES